MSADRTSLLKKLAGFSNKGPNPFTSAIDVE